MKVFICADIEGTAGIAAWDEAEKGLPDYPEFRALMTAELVAACEGARAAGADEVVVKDAHWTGRNLLLDRLPDYVRIVRGWSGHPDRMMFGLDSSFDAALYTGFHAASGSDDNPLAHSFTRRVARLTINGAPASEFTVNALVAARHGVPSVFLSGDAAICDQAARLVPGIATLATGEGHGAATVSLSPAASVRAIRAGVEAALARDRSGCLPPMPQAFELEIEYATPVEAQKARWYPGADCPGPRRVRLAAADLWEMQRALLFLL